MPTNRPTEADMVRVTVYLNREAFEALQRLKVLCGHATIEETIDKAMRLYTDKHGSKQE